MWTVHAFFQTSQLPGEARPTPERIRSLGFAAPQDAAFDLDGLNGRYERIGLHPPFVLNRLENLELQVRGGDGQPLPTPAAEPAALTLFAVETGEVLVAATIRFTPASADEARSFIRLLRDDVAETRVLFDSCPPLEAVTAGLGGWPAALGPPPAGRAGLLAELSTTRESGNVANGHLVVLPAPSGLDDQDLETLALNGMPGPLAQPSGVVWPTHGNHGAARRVTLAATGTAIAGHLPHHETVMLFSQVQVLCCLARLRSLARGAFEDVEEIARIMRSGNPHRYRRQLAQMAVRLGDRESELVFGVEAYADNEFALGSPMLGEYHRTLAEVIGMNRGLAVVDALVQRLRSGLEAARLEVQDHLANVAGVLGSIALLLTLVFGIYGVSTQEIEPSNLLQAGYWWIYLVAVFSLYALVGLLTRRWLPAVPRRPRAADG